MENKKLNNLFISLAILVTLYLNYLILKPFLSPVLLGVIFSIVFYPVYLKLLKFTKGKKGIASSAVCLLVTVIIIIPLIFLTESIVSEIISLYVRIDAAIQADSYKEILPFLDDKTLQNLYQKVNRYLTALQIDTKNIFLNTLKESSSYGISMLTGSIKNLSLFIVNLFLMLFTMYYLLKDSNMIAAEIKGLIPLPEHQKERIFARLKDIIYATIYGTLVAATVQGLLGGIAFWALGISSPVLWGVVMGLLAIFPVFGAFFIWLPASVILLIQGSYLSAITLLLWGVFVISMVDNLIWPLLVSGRAMLHPLATFFSFLGGIIVFGPIGLFVGPFVFALLLILLDIVKEINQPERVSTGT
ncbi:MAG: AI-2E family transporter [Deltaproteobacteria bacterium]|nr:AI-2E family transporter [Deltaproteobacteria bacterium]